MFSFSHGPRVALSHRAREHTAPRARGEPRERRRYTQRIVTRLATLSPFISATVTTTRNRIRTSSTRRTDDYTHTHTSSIPNVCVSKPAYCLFFFFSIDAILFCRHVLLSIPRRARPYYVSVRAAALFACRSQTRYYYFCFLPRNGSVRKTKKCRRTGRDAAVIRPAAAARTLAYSNRAIREKQRACGS